ncbi:potassium-transporting ATPase subunit KdpA [Roseateles sp. BYS180W]|uniref:Potassium-transporting ATPase potassium-binding subunit n=1 Tax=Roseateles rivi TaxID=3299028 RepID=A0ABW7FXL5_9BURK
MSTMAWAQLGLFMGVLLLLAWPLSRWLAAVADGRLPRWMGRVEQLWFRLGGIAPEQGQHWKQYALALLLFNFLGLLAVYGLQRFQDLLPLNPQGMGAVSPDSAFNTAVSFVANTNWQGYGGETTMSYLTQMLALTVQNFVSAATGIAVVFALMRGFARKNHASPSAGGTSSRLSADVGNFWADLSRVTLWVLLPISLVLALFFVGQGVIQNLQPYKTVRTLQTQSYQQAQLDPAGQVMKNAQGQPLMQDLQTDSQTLAMGPVASQLAIKMLGTNGGGFFNANSAHPYENPTPLSNFVQMLAIFLIPAALCFTFGRQVQDMRQGVAILAAMSVMFVAGVVLTTAAEQAGNPLLHALGVDDTAGNLEGKETRFGIAASSLFAVVTTAASCGAVNAMHDSMTPIGGMVPLVMMQLGEVVFGGVGTGLYGMLVFALLAVFIAGLMIGRTPEYLGKKIEPFEMKMCALTILVTPTVVLVGTAVAVLSPAGVAGVANPGAHGFSEILYALTSAANNNGSAFAGLSANTPFYNTLLGLAMWLGRFGVIVPVLALAGALAAKKRVPVSSGSLPTHGALFVALLVGTVLMVGLLNYVPALALGPIVEQLLLWK